MITETPPRTNISSSVARKRDRTSVQQDTFSFASAPKYNNNDTTGNDLRSFFNKTSPYPNSIAAAAAATVSPFVDRMTFTTSVSNSNSHPNLKLESISEEPPSNGYELSQDSNTSSVTFGSINNAGLNMDCSGSSSNIMIGTMVGSAVESVVGCSVGGGGEPSSISSGSITTTTNNSATGIGGVGFHSLHSECPPPTKRARLDHAYQTIDEDMMGSTSSPPNVLTFQSTPSSKQQYQQQQCTEKRMGGNCFNCFGFNNIGRTSDVRGVMCCHVCSEEDSANNTSSSVTSSPAASFNTTTNETTAVPKSHSLLNFFQSTKKQPSSHLQKLPAANFGNQQQQHNDAPSSQNDTNKSISSNLSPCRYCDKPTCSSCTRQCEMCQHHFCTFCTKVDYDSSITERILCFDCDTGNNNEGGNCCDMQIG